MVKLDILTEYASQFQLCCLIHILFTSGQTVTPPKKWERDKLTRFSRVLVQYLLPRETGVSELFTENSALEHTMQG